MFEVIATARDRDALYGHGDLPCCQEYWCSLRVDERVVNPQRNEASYYDAVVTDPGARSTDDQPDPESTDSTDPIEERVASHRAAREDWTSPKGALMVRVDFGTSASLRQVTDTQHAVRSLLVQRRLHAVSTLQDCDIVTAADLASRGNQDVADKGAAGFCNALAAVFFQLLCLAGRDRQTACRAGTFHTDRRPCQPSPARPDATGRQEPARFPLEWEAGHSSLAS